MSLTDQRYTTLMSPDELLRFQSRVHQMIPRTWGNGRNLFCMLSAAIPGADSINACVAAGWPEWFVELAVAAYDGENVPLLRGGVSVAESNEWAASLITAAAEPVDYDLAYRRCVSEFLGVIGANTGPSRSKVFIYAASLKNILFNRVFLPNAADDFNHLARHGIRTGLIHREQGAPYAEYVAEHAHGHPALPAYLYTLAVTFRNRKDQPRAVRDLREGVRQAVLGARDTSDAQHQVAAPACSRVGQRTTYLPFTQLGAQSEETGDAGSTISVAAGTRD